MQESHCFLTLKFKNIPLESYHQSRRKRNFCAIKNHISTKKSEIQITLKVYRIVDQLKQCQNILNLKHFKNLNGCWQYNTYLWKVLLG